MQLIKNTTYDLRHLTLDEFNVIISALESTTNSEATRIANNIRKELRG